MTAASPSREVYIGWDVGAWNCDRNGRSRDAIVLLDATLNIIGRPWRGNLRDSINAAATTADWVGKLFELCREAHPAPGLRATMAIDTPLGFPVDFVRLASDLQGVAHVDRSHANPYLFRATERRLFDRGLSPMSAVQAMIGSQATKGMHTLAKFAPTVETCGVWADGKGFRAIEAYPAACRHSPAIMRLLAGRDRLKPDDLEDARVCALVAYLFATDRGILEAPSEAVPSSEGWIWVPSTLK